MRLTILSLAAFSASCVQDTPFPSSVSPPVYSTRIVSISDRSGVGTASCPSTHRIVGGGCNCEGLSDVLFSNEPVGNSIVCACYDYGPAGGAVTASAICMTSTVAGTLKDGLSMPDPEAEAALERLRAMQTAQRSL